MKQSELLRLIYDTIKNEYQPPNVISGSKYIGKGYFTDKQVNIICDIISEHFINHDMKYIAFVVVKAISDVNYKSNLIFCFCLPFCISSSLCWCICHNKSSLINCISC